jgi:coenzyme F420 hydrogenase subunit delta
MDTGTGVRKLLFTITIGAIFPEEIVIVDAVDFGQNIGKVTEISASDLPPSKVDDFSLHQVPTSNMLRELQKQHGINVTVIACDVEVTAGQINPGLSPIIQNAVSIAARQLAVRFRLQPAQ